LDISPTFLLTLGLAIIAGIGWLIRLESKASAAAKDVDSLSKDFYLHDSDKSVHHDGAELDRRFNVIDSGMQTIQKGIDKLNERFDRFLNK
jgi:hypothetical protein